MVSLSASIIFLLALKLFVKFGVFVVSYVMNKSHPLYANTFGYTSDAQPVFRGTPVCRRGHLGVPRNFHLSL
jgi:hypothetical protein